MTDAPFVAAGWLGTAGAIALYAVSVLTRLRRATRQRATIGRSGR